jgi:hypothetical protein
LAVLTVAVDNGVVEARTRDGDIAENVHNAQVTWTAVTGDLWARGGKFTQFSLANSSPHFPTSGQELLRGYAARGRSMPEGVIAIDPLAMRALLRATGPVTVPGYGKLTADNCVQRTTHDAYGALAEPGAAPRLQRGAAQDAGGALAERPRPGHHR